MTIEFAKLAEPFPADDIEWRVQSSGKRDNKVWARVLAYVTSRAVQDRLDAVCGVGNWRNEFTTGPGGGVLCGISIRVTHEDGTSEWVTKYDGSENTDIEAVKGGLSGAMKRAAVQWGIGRYLYNLPAGWAQIETDKKKALHSDKLKEGKEWFHWNPPALPPWALPEGAAAAPQKPIAAPKGSNGTPPPTNGPITDADLKRLASHAKAHDIAPAIVTKLAEERFEGRGPRELRRWEFDALWERIGFGEWLPDDIDQTLGATEEVA